MRTINALALFIAGASALRKPHLNITEITCTPGQGPSCLNQCARNGCPGATNEATLNACLAQIDPSCSVQFSGLLEVNLEKNLDFCNYPPNGVKPGGWVFNVPSMGNWDSIINPWLIIPKTSGTQECDYLMSEIILMADYQPATISTRNCIDQTAPELQKFITVHRDFDFRPNEYAYPISVMDWMNSMFISPVYTQCFEQLSTLKFAVEVNATMNGGYELYLPGIVQSGTIPGREFYRHRTPVWPY
eukprot:Protomagalhaensia_wolfi_Nauph_80__249@NODE_113_length_3622_cov_233_229975_g86_i0_p1_GENE_NODE_113_length_3622_cov_233_229975_g86_i0NODE_113_length_3622_cov_233_229975_g86_i0_p1_ORF_typecomplete_len246_score41_62_NODE_113_length_3622_cov_233_229975_g86_i07591496